MKRLLPLVWLVIEGAFVFFGMFYLSSLLVPLGAPPVLVKSLQGFGGFVAVLISIAMHFHPGYRYARSQTDRDAVNPPPETPPPR